ncbi:MAG: hypothetical protein Q4A58_03410 [Fusobacterium sp.]|uniref:hypothetical protein n=1 Tax=Fusobacterium sp. TaxID=68766 RepID=UPI0026DC75CD|nr:hypothetical protein [Fusobacterium sp.]MDO4690325.1 hypothetical protein [Fusobacterium sp.]
MKNFIAHSQGTIKYKAAIDSLYKTEEGKLLLKDNVKNTLLVGLAITPGMYKDLEGKFEEISKMKGEDNKIKLEKLVNKKDIVPGMWGHKPNTNWETHPVANYNLKDYIRKPDGIYERKTDKNGKTVPNITIVIEEVIDRNKRFNYNSQGGKK